MRKLSIGVGWQGDFDIHRVIEHAKVADDAGVDSLLVAEAWGRDAFTTLAVLARETRRIKLGTSIVNIFSRSAAALAQHFATLDELSGGRMIIGLGSSGHRVIEHFHGVPFQLPLARTREYVDIIRTLLRGDPLHYEGRIHTLSRGFTLRFTPVRSQIPIWLASVTPRSVAMTAEIADGWLPIFIPREKWAEQLERFYTSVRAAGRDPATVDVRNPSAVVVTDHPERARAATAANAAFYIARMGDFYYEHFVRLGYRREADAVREAWRHGGASAGANALPPALVESLGVAGDLSACQDALARAEEAGFTCHSVSVPEPDPHRRRAILEKLVASA